MKKKFVRSLTWILGLLIVPVAIFSVSIASAQQGPTHPLDQLTATEVNAVITTLKSDGKVSNASRFAMVRLNPPPKAEVWDWQPGEAIPSRKAFVAIKEGLQVYESVVDLKSSQVETWQEVTGLGQPSILWSEYDIAEELLKEDPRWQQAMAKRGITEYENVACSPLSATSPLAYQPGQRLLVLPCALETGDENFWGHPIEGVKGIVDLEAQKVVEVVDQEVVPVPRQNVGFNLESIQKQVGRLRKAPLPFLIGQPDGATYKVDGQMVTWQNWQFHFRMDPRVGPVIDTVTYNDQEKVRQVMYEGSVGEIIVHYADPSPDWYDRNFLDAGDFDMGRLTAELIPERDCPANAQFFSATFTDEMGEPYTQDNALCLFEDRGDGGIEWRHYEDWHETSHSRSRRNLVLRYITAIGNYDYILDWSFQQNGMIKVAIGASGTEETKAVDSEVVGDEHHAEDTLYGTLIDKHLVGTTHQHLYNFRLDFDVDGVENTVIETTAKQEEVDNPKGTKIVQLDQPFFQEQEARRPYDLMSYWRVVNDQVKNQNGYPVGYALQPRWNTDLLLDLDNLPPQRFGYLKYNLWVTPYQPDELYPTGTYPVASYDGDGLLKWTEADRSIHNQDIVLWYTFGNTHIVRPEEWPILPVEWVTFEIRPFNFFARTPSLDLPEYH